MISNRIEVWTNVRASGKSAMDHLFSRFAGMYHAMWQKHFDTPEKVENWKLVWAEAFAEECITPEEVAKALKACLRSNRAFPPSLPEFIEYCRPPIDYDKAFCEAVDQMGKRKRPVVRLVDGEMRHLFEHDTWSNPAIFWAAKAMGSDLWERYQNVKARWAYELDQVLSGPVQPVPKNTGLLPDNTNKSKELTEDEQKNIQDMLAKVRAMLDDNKETANE